MYGYCKWRQFKGKQSGEDERIGQGKEMSLKNQINKCSCSKHFQ